MRKVSPEMARKVLELHKLGVKKIRIADNPEVKLNRGTVARIVKNPINWLV